MSENRLRWFGHAMRKEETEAVKLVVKMNVEGKKVEKDERRDGLKKLQNIRGL